MHIIFVHIDIEYVWFLQTRIFDLALSVVFNPPLAISDSFERTKYFAHQAY